MPPRVGAEHQRPVGRLQAEIGGEAQMGPTEPTRESVVTQGPHVDRRADLLLKMYDQMFNDINRHILVVWQSIGVVVGSFALLTVAEKKVVSTDDATSLIVHREGWIVAHLYDSAYWYNRNLVMIANIEKLFL